MAICGTTVITLQTTCSICGYLSSPQVGFKQKTAPFNFPFVTVCLECLEKAARELRAIEEAC